jgi:hypothetical protein
MLCLCRAIGSFASQQRPSQGPEKTGIPGPRYPPARNPSVLKLGAALCGASSDMLCTLAREHDPGTEIYMYRLESHALSHSNTPITISQQLPPSPRPTFDRDVHCGNWSRRASPDVFVLLYIKAFRWT